MVYSTRNDSEHSAHRRRLIRVLSASKRSKVPFHLSKIKILNEEVKKVNIFFFVMLQLQKGCKAKTALVLKDWLTKI